MKTIVLDPNKMNRNHSLKIFEKINKKLLKQIRAEKNYQTPKGYISWDELSGIVGVGLSTCDVEFANADFSAFVHKTSWEVGNSVPLGTRGIVRHGSPAATQGILIPVNLKMRNHSHLCGE